MSIVVHDSMLESYMYQKIICENVYHICAQSVPFTQLQVLHA